MDSGMSYWEKAMDAGHREMELLKEYKVEEAETLARERKEYMKQAMESASSDQIEILLEKLSKLKHLQGRITSEARKIQTKMKADLKRMRNESTRMSGYRDAAKITPLANRFLNKQG